MSDTHDLRPFGWTLLAICYLVTVAAVLAVMGRNIEAVGVSAAVTGLIGVIKLPAQRSVTVDNPPDQPVPVDAGA